MIKFNNDSDKVFEYFFDICKIPHGSGNTTLISDYCEKFAKDRNLKYIRQENNNLIIFKDATEGYENKEPIILQGHLDMVCEKEADVQIDFEKDGIEAYVDGDFITAKGTTLGGDDGIAVAYILALLDSEEIPHPPIEAVLTVDEETGMNGASSLDVSCLKAKRLINLDSENEGCIWASCAGGGRTDSVFKGEIISLDSETCSIEISGLNGGHSGTEIDKGLANANKLLAEILYNIMSKENINLFSFNGGSKDNAIPVNSVAEFCVKDRDLIQTIITESFDCIKDRFNKTEDNITIDVKFCPKSLQNAFDDESTCNFISFLNNAPNGVISMSDEIKNLVQTSLNNGIVKTEDNCIIASFSERSSVDDEKENLVLNLESLTEKYNGEFVRRDFYPAWEFKKESMLRDVFVKCYEEILNKKVDILAIHAGLECGIFCGKIKGIDCISVGPDIYDIHTPREKLSISSVVRVWDTLKLALKSL